MKIHYSGCNNVWIFVISRNDYIYDYLYDYSYDWNWDYFHAWPISITFVVTIFLSLYPTIKHSLSSSYP